MGTLFKGFVKSCFITHLKLVRFKSKINITNPRPPHFKKFLVETVCVPYFSKVKHPNHIPLYDRCDSKSKQPEKEIHPFTIILGKELLNWFNHSKLIAFFHCNIMTREEAFQSKILLKNINMKVLIYNNYIVKKGLEGTQYEPVLIMYQGHTATVVCPEADLFSLKNILKKIPKFILMGAVVNNTKFLSHSEIMKYGDIDSLDTARIALVGTLNSASQNLVHQLNCPSNLLLQCLNQHKEHNFKKS